MTANGNQVNRKAYLLAPIVIMLAGTLAGCQGQVTPQNKSEPQASQAGTLWPDLLTSSQAEAAKLIDEPVLTGIVSQDVGLGIRCPTDYLFTFASAKGDAAGVWLQATASPKVKDARVLPSTEEPPSLTPDQLTRLSQAVAAMKYGPTEICGVVLAEAEGYKKGPEIKLYLDEVLEPANAELAGQVPNWTVWYLVGPGSIKSLLVSSQTGEITERLYFDPAPTGTPAP
jgi:hypothetical protein